MELCEQCQVSKANFITERNKPVCSNACATEIIGLQITDSLQIPKHHLLFRTMFGGSPFPLMYGTSHIRDILVRDGKDVFELDSLIQDCFKRRRKIIKKVLSQPTIIREYGHESISEHFKGVMLNPWISAATFNYLAPIVDKISNNEPETALRRFLEIAMDIEDWVVNWGHINGFLKAEINFHDITGFKEYWMLKYPHEDGVMDMPFPTEINVYKLEPKIHSYIISIITSIRNFHSPKLPINYESFRSKKPFTRGISKGTLLYRGYRHYRGPIDNETSFAWFALDIITTLSYMIPPEIETNPKYLKGRPKIKSFLSKDYCQNIGGSAVYKFKQDVELLDFSSVHTMKYIRDFLVDNDAPKKVITAFNNGWKITSDSLNRDSQEFDDAIFAEWLCQRGFDGYIATGINLFDEILTCGFQDKIEYIGNYDPKEDMNFHICNEPYNRYNLVLSDYDIS